MRRQRKCALGEIEPPNDPLAGEVDGFGVQISGGDMIIVSPVARIIRPPATM